MDMYERIGGTRSTGAIAAGAALATVLIGSQLATGSHKVAIGLSLLPLLVVLVTQPTIPLVLLGASLPVLNSFTASGFLVSTSDVLLMIVIVTILLQTLTADSAPAFRALQPIALPILIYAGIMIVLLPAHLGVSEFFQTGQRFELFLVPLVVGAFTALTGHHVRLLKAYVVVATVLAVTWPLHIADGQKNPVGQLIANAILLLVGFAPLRRLMPLLLVLVPGLLVTQSRGAILSVLVGVVVIWLMQGLGPRVVVRRVAPVLLVAGAAFILLPASMQQRITTLSASTDSRAGYAIVFRDQYRRVAWDVIREHPLVGVGIGNYLKSSVAASGDSPGAAEDPHQVLLLQAAEGGYPLAAAFVVLIAGTVFVLYRLRTLMLAPAAAGVLVATVFHGLVDVYWVRVTPVLGWLLVGMVCGIYYRRHHGQDASAE